MTFAPIGSPCRCGGTYIAYRGKTNCNRCGTFETGEVRGDNDMKEIQDQEKNLARMVTGEKSELGDPAPTIQVTR